ncbi:fumarylacetoacetate hydrolase family protein [Halocatena salina]|uniref:Fumarylacetoacetate hydrolase family protein n=1 Tax=Halocatena salina TaxID=2934340 RepID=A0A8U0A5M0_9EURY|nr:fumarylacetoacetate hydrolase family protein [Halocatena salina]UPM43253.1 fumarylacetoacetate hydrolase family protein [Halocatena salina]
MRTVRFRDPAGNVRRGEWSGQPGDEITLRTNYGGRVALGNETFLPEEIDVLPPCDPSKIVCVGLNYEDHAIEQNESIPERPSYFLKPPSTVAGHGDTITLPAGKERIDYEAELAVVIADTCKNVRAKNAMDVVAGFTCLNDISNRDDQSIEQNWVRGKAFDGSAPIGPVISRPENVANDASIQLWVNGDCKQDSTIDELIVPIEALIEELTSFMTLRSGDIISTGTPAGVGPLRDGDEVDIEIDGIGTLSHTVRIP